MGTRKKELSEKEWIAFGRRMKKLSADLKEITLDAEKLMSRYQVQPLERARNHIHEACNRMQQRADSHFSFATSIHWFFGDVD